MSKYRIIEEINFKGDIKYIPEKRYVLFLWCGFYSDPFAHTTLQFKELDEAEQWIKDRKNRDIKQRRVHSHR